MSASLLQQYTSQGLDYIEIDHPLGYVKLTTFGAHILSYVPRKDGRERLFLSPHACLNGEKAIRGGIPLCWPWFSDAHGQTPGSLPAHGFMRTRLWRLVSHDISSERAILYLQPTRMDGPGISGQAQLSLRIALSDKLEVSLVTENCGEEHFSFNTALHSYFYVEDIKQVSLEGLEGDYLDKTQQWLRLVTPSPYHIQQEVDRIHLFPAKHIEINVAKKHTTFVDSSGHDSIVVWNPWLGAASFADMDAFSYKHMLCVETAITQHKSLAPGETHTLTQQIG